MFHPLLFLALATQTLSQALYLPALTGASQVGTVSFELIDTSRLDPFAPDSRPRDLMVSVFYPIQHTRRYTLSPAYSTHYSAYLEWALGIPAVLASSLLSRAYAGAYLHPTPNKRKQPPLLLFSPGYSRSRVDYTAKMSDLASLGFLVIGIDHPFDTTFLDYPDGRILANTIGQIQSPEQAASIVDVRVEDFCFVLNILSKNATLAKQIPGIHGKLDVKNVGVFGHSLGGAASAAAMLADKRFACGSNLDGQFVGPVANAGVTRPFLSVAAEFRNITSGTVWQGFYDASTSWKLMLRISGARHGTFSDQAALYGYLKELGPIEPLPEEVLGTIDGERILVIESAYLGAFFEMCLLGKKRKLLMKSSADFPEVVFQM